MHYTYTHTDPKTNPFKKTLTSKKSDLKGRRECLFGFNGMERDDEVKGKGNSLDFGARIYDSRLGRFLALDPMFIKLPFISHYSYANNSPIFMLDLNGEVPKVAIILAGEYQKYDFDGHYKALKAKGYEVVRVSTGKEAIEKLAEFSTPDDPIENLIFLSHGSPGGLSNGEASGIYTDMEIEIYAKSAYTLSIIKETGKLLGIITDENDPNFDYQKYDELVQTSFEVAEERWSNISGVKEKMVRKYKAETGAVTVEDIGDAVDVGDISTKSLKVVVGGCNTAGNETLNNQDVFTTELALELNTEVIGSQGASDYAEPRENTSKRVSDKTWVKTDGSGNRKSLNKKTIDLTEPE